MWCSKCQRDVPAVSIAGGGLRCTRCEQDFHIASSAQRPPAMAGGLPCDAPPERPLEAALRCEMLAEADWKLEADVRGVQRLIRSLQGRCGEKFPPAAPGHTLAYGPQSATDSQLSREAPPVISAAASMSSSAVHAAGWLLLSLGLATFACGGVLLGWSFGAGRDDLWPMGLPLTLIGQAGLILGLVLQLDGLWSTNRKTAAALTELDGALKHVRHATSLISTSQSAAGQSFYLHLAEGASPQLLLADLKGQMDLLSQQMARNAH